MEENTLKAGENATLANDLIEKALAEPQTEQTIQVKLPTPNTVNLPGGYRLLTGEVIRTAEVRELNGFDEEAISRTGTLGKAVNAIISRAVVKVGDEKATDDILDGLLSGDRDALALGIYRVTFGNEAELSGFCEGCSEFKTVNIDVDTDIKTKPLIDPVNDRQFIIEGRDSEYLVALPSGKCQKELNIVNGEKTLAEMQTILLEHCVVQINGTPVYSPTAVKKIGLVDRRKIAEEISKRNPGPQLEDVKVTCPDCGTEVVVPISFGALFQF